MPYVAWLGTNLSFMTSEMLNLVLIVLWAGWDMLDAQESFAVRLNEQVNEWRMILQSV